MGVAELQSARRRWRLWIALATVTILIISLSGGWAFYRAEFRQVQTETAETLSAIAKLKVAAIVGWRETLASEAKRLANGSFLRDSIHKLENPAIREEVRRRLREQANSELANVMIFSPDGRLLLDVAEDSPETTQQEIAEHRTALAEAVKNPHAVLSDLHRSADGTINMDVAAAVRDAASNPVAVVLVRSDATRTLFPLLERLPTESPSAETLLVRRDGDDILYLNNLRHQADTALNLRIPLTQTQLPAAQAVLGATGIVEGADYRGIDVLTEAQPIPDSTWKLLAKVDRREIEAEAGKSLSGIILTTGLLSLLASLLVALIAARRQLGLARELQTEHDLLALEEQAHHSDLTRSADQLYGALEASPIPLALNNGEGRITFLNTAFTRVFGYTQKDIPVLDEWWTKAYPDPDYRQKMQAAWEAQSVQCLNTGADWIPFLADVHCKNGECRSVVCYYSPVAHSKDGTCIVNLYDITQHKESEKRILRLSNLYLAQSQCSQAIINSAGEDELIDRVCKVIVEHGGMQLAWIGLVDGSSSRLVKQVGSGEGKEYLDELGTSLAPDAPRGQGPTGICFRENRPVWCQDFANDPLTAPWREQGQSFGWDASGNVPLRKEGKPVGVLKVFSKTKNAFDTETRALLQEMADSISFALDACGREQARRQAEIDLRINRDMLARVINAIPQAVFWKDRDSVYLGCNDRYARTAGLASPEEIVGKTDFDLPWPREEAEAYRAADAVVIEKEHPLLHNVRLRKQPGGVKAWMDASKVPLVDPEGRVYGVLGVLEDITEQKSLERGLQDAMQRAEAASRAKGQFLAVMSHELRTPLSGVLGFAELLDNTALNPEQTEFVRTIRRSSDQLLHVVNDILDFSSIEEGGLHLEKEPFVLAELLESAEAIIRKSAQDKGLAFHFNLSAGIPGVLVGDARRILQVLLNLLGNAVKFTSTGSVKLLVSRLAKGHRDDIKFAVEDTGPGIAAETRENLFKPFAQADATLSRRFRGTGLGLAISLRLARAMGGDITLESIPGLGSTFTFSVPCEVRPTDTAKEAPAPAAEVGTPPLEAGPSGDARPVLLVDDDHVSLLLTEKILSPLGYIVEIATSGQAAIDTFVPGKHRAILMDVQMPGINGIDATKRIRATEKEVGARRVPIIAVTANVMAEDRERCISAGMDDVVTKPLNRAELTGKLARLVSAT